MSITTTWIVEQMNCYPTAEGQTDVVFNVAWRANATDGTYNATSYGSVGITYVAGSPYTPYADLTQAQVVGWVQAALGQEQVDAIDAGLATNIANQVNPPTVTPPLPWVS
jgi:hypothetical protein